jgi:WD40 repeat protein
VIRKGSVGLFGVREEDFWGWKLSAIHWSPDGKYIASVYDRRIFVWEVDTGRLVKEFFNSSAQSYATGNGSMFTLHSDGAIAWGPDSRSIASVSLFGDVEIYNL